MLIRKFYLFVLFIFCSLYSIGQSQSIDTLLEYTIPEVRFTGSRTTFFSEDNQLIEIDTLSMLMNNSSNLGELLSVSSPVFVKSYGSTGSLSTISLRGSGSNHTQINWNGFPINSITLGTMDLSNVSVDMTDNINITKGAAGSLHGSGTFGGSINLINNPDWDNKTNIRFSSEFGSFHNQRYGLKMKFGNNKFRYNIYGFLQHAENDFTYYDPRPDTILHREHNRLKNKGTVQNIYFRLPGKNTIAAGIWYQDKDKEIPDILGVTTESNQFQNDRTFKSYIKWTNVFEKSSLKINIAYFDDYQLFTDKTNADDNDYFIYSEIKTKCSYNEINYRYYFSDNIIIDCGGNYSFKEADVTAYENIVNEHDVAFFGAAKFNLSNLISNISFRKEYNTSINPKPLFSAGLRYELQKNKLFVRANYSDKFRRPTFNDKYWPNAGNPDLLPEEGWSSEFGLKYLPFNKLKGLSLKTTVYYSEINNLIQWMGMFGPQNFNKVLSRGIESSLGFDHKFNTDFLIKTNINYSYTKSTNKDTDNENLENKQLFYIPFNEIKGMLNILYRKFYIGYNINHSGKYYTTADNSSELPGYTISNLYLGSNFKFKKSGGNIQFKILNIFNTEYQVITEFPMPGRTYYLSLGIDVLN